MECGGSNKLECLYWKIFSSLFAASQYREQPAQINNILETNTLAYFARLKKFCSTDIKKYEISFLGKELKKN